MRLIYGCVLYTRNYGTWNNIFEYQLKHKVNVKLSRCCHSKLLVSECMFLRASPIGELSWLSLIPYGTLVIILILFC